MCCNMHDCRYNKDGYCELINYLTINNTPIYCENYKPKFDYWSDTSQD